MSKVLQIEFTAYEKEKNKELSRYGRQCPQEKTTIDYDAQCAYSQCQDVFFDSMRLLYYGDDWLRLLFPSLFFDKC